MDRIALDCVSTGSSEKRKRCRSSGAAFARALRRLRPQASPTHPVLRRSAPAGLRHRAARAASRRDGLGGRAGTGGGSGSSLGGRGAWRGDQPVRPESGCGPSGPVICRCSLTCYGRRVLVVVSLESRCRHPNAHSGTRHWQRRRSLHQRWWASAPRRSRLDHRAALPWPGKIPANQALAARTW